jgi:hypothetical protein
VLKIDEEKKKQALEQESNLPAVPVLRKSKRAKKKRKKKKIALGAKFKNDDGKIYTIIKIYSKKVAAQSGNVKYEFNIPYAKKHLV